MIISKQIITKVMSNVDLSLYEKGKCLIGNIENKLCRQGKFSIS